MMCLMFRVFSTYYLLELKRKEGPEERVSHVDVFYLHIKILFAMFGQH